MTKLSPEQKLMKAIFGTTRPSKEQLERAEEQMYERQAASVTKEEFEKAVGCSEEEFSHKMMLHIGWCDSVGAWRMQHANDRKYLVSKDKPMFTFSQVIDMVQQFYRQGVEDGKSGTSEYDRLWEINHKETQSK